MRYQQPWSIALTHNQDDEPVISKTLTYTPTSIRPSPYAFFARRNICWGCLLHHEQSPPVFQPIIQETIFVRK
jgi:hypothetical protein